MDDMRRTAETLLVPEEVSCATRCMSICPPLPAAPLTAQNILTSIPRPLVSLQYQERLLDRWLTVERVLRHQDLI